MTVTTQSQSAKDKFCTTREAATLLGVSIGSIQQWVERGVLEAWKTDGGHRRVLRESVQKMLDQIPGAGPKPSLSTPTLAPVVAAPTALDTPLSAEQAAMRRLRVMVIDDDPLMLRLYEERMKRWTLAPAVTVSDSVVAGLVLIGRTFPDLLVLDLLMPGMDGFSLLRNLENLPDLKDTTIVVASGLSAKEVAQRGGVPATVVVLTKPIHFDLLLEIALEIAAKKGLNRRAG